MLEQAVPSTLSSLFFCPDFVDIIVRQYLFSCTSLLSSSRLSSLFHWWKQKNFRCHKNFIFFTKKIGILFPNSKRRKNCVAFLDFVAKFVRLADVDTMNFWYFSFTFKQSANLFLMKFEPKCFSFSTVHVSHAQLSAYMFLWMKFCAWLSS